MLSLKAHSKNMEFTKAVGAFLMLVCVASVQSQQICDQYGSTTSGRFIVMNNRWGTSAEQCIEVTGNGFRIARQDGQAATNGAPVSYPAIYFGCHYSNCSPGTNLPKRLNEIQSANGNIAYNFVEGTYDAAYDIWLDPNPNTGSVNAQEIMIWFNRQGPIQPIGSQTATANIAGVNWAVWQGSNGQNQVISYLADSAIPSLNFNVMDFINDGKNRGLYSDQWYLTSIQAGFEPWVGGVGLAVTNFDVNVV